MEETQIVQLVRRAQRGDRDAFGRLIAEFEPTIFAIVLRRMRNPSEARDLTQEVFLRALRKLHQLREAERFVGWLRQIAVRMAFNRMARRPQESACTPEAFSRVEADRPDAPLVRLLQAERAERVRGGLSRLRPMDREALTAFYFRGQSLQEMSASCGAPVGTIKRRLHTARLRLRRELADLQPD